MNYLKTLFLTMTVVFFTWNNNAVAKQKSVQENIMAELSDKNSSIKSFMFIFYVSDQEKAKEFYQTVLAEKPSLDVPGMTMFNLPDNIQLGLMPEKGIAPILGDSVPHPSTGIGIPRSELYLLVENPGDFLQRLVAAGGKVLSPLQKRPWGDIAGYGIDLDGHILAFAVSSPK